MRAIVSEQIQFIGLKDVEAMEQETAQKLATEYYEKIKRKIKGETNVIIHIKVHDKGGKKQYEILSRLEFPSKPIESSATDFELAKALHVSLGDILKQIQHRFHTDRTRPCC